MWQRLVYLCVCVLPVRPVPWRLLHNFCGNLTLGRCSYATPPAAPVPRPLLPVCAQKLVEKNMAKKIGKSNLKKVNKRQSRGYGRDGQKGVARLGNSTTTKKRSYNFWQRRGGWSRGVSYKRER